MKSLIKKYLSGKSSATEQKELLDWLREDSHLSIFKSEKKKWEDEIAQEELSPEYQQSWIRVQNMIQQKSKDELLLAKRKMNIFKYAAIFILMFSGTTVLYEQQSKTTVPPVQLIYTSVSADFGQISKVVLPDSTVIWVNSGSTIKYNNQFSASNRDIELTGEAFFKVHTNKELPLVVNSENLRIEVLGTEFCVSAYPEEKNIQVVLEKGKVELTSPINSNFREELKPGELASFSKQQKHLAITKVNTSLFTSWKDGLINIYNLPLSELVIRLEKRYNQKFKVDQEIKNIHYTFTIKNENLNSILSLMEKITPVDAIQHDNVIELKYNKKKLTY